MSQHLKTLFGRNQELRPLLDKVLTLSALQHHFSSVAPTHIAESSQILGLQQGILVVATANATFAAKLRQLAPELALQMQKRGCEVSGIRVKVQVADNRPPLPAVPRKLSQTAQQALDDLALGLNDSPLKRALTRMTKNKN